MFYCCFIFNSFSIKCDVFCFCCYMGQGALFFSVVLLAAVRALELCIIIISVLYIIMLCHKCDSRGLLIQ